MIYLLPHYRFLPPFPVVRISTFKVGVTPTITHITKLVTAFLYSMGEWRNGRRTKEISTLALLVTVWLGEIGSLCFGGSSPPSPLLIWSGNPRSPKLPSVPPYPGRCVKNGQPQITLAKLSKADNLTRVLTASKSRLLQPTLVLGMRVGALYIID